VASSPQRSENARLPPGNGRGDDEGKEHGGRFPAEGLRIEVELGGGHTAIGEDRAAVRDENAGVKGMGILVRGLETEVTLGKMLRIIFFPEKSLRLLSLMSLEVSVKAGAAEPIAGKFPMRLAVFGPSFVCACI